MQITINLSNKTLAILVGVLTFLAIGLVVYAYNNIPNPGHGANQIVVNIDGQEMTLQEAIDSGKIGKGELVCVTFRKVEGHSPEFWGSTDGNNYNPGDVVQSLSTGNGLKCINNWKMTGCSQAGDGEDNDNAMVGGNGCSGDPGDNSPDGVFIRCCKIK